MIPLVPVREGGRIVHILQNVNKLVGVVSSSPELTRCKDFYQCKQDDVENKKNCSRSEGLPESHQSVVCDWWRSWMLGVRVVPVVKLRHVNGLIKAIESDLEIRSFSEELGEWNLVPFPVVKKTEEPHGGDEECNKRQNSSHCGKSAPNEDEKFGCHFTKPFVNGNKLCVHPHTAQKTPRGGQDKNKSRI